MGKTFLNLMFYETILLRKSNTESRRQDVKIFSGTDCRVIGLKFEGSSVSPCLCINIVQAFFHSEGTCPDNQIKRIKSVKKERR